MHIQFRAVLPREFPVGVWSSDLITRKDFISRLIKLATGARSLAGLGAQHRREVAERPRIHSFHSLISPSILLFFMR
jgi:hypothetical protein